MTVRAVVLPGTPLLVPGAAGDTTVLDDTRAAALAALGRLVDGARAVQGDGTAPVVVVAPGPAPGSAPTRGPARASLAAAGVADAWLDTTWAVATRPAAQDCPVAGAAASVGLLALAGAGWTGPVDVVELDDADAPAAHALGARLARQGARLVVVHDPRAAAPDAVLAGFGAAPDAGHRHVATGKYEQRRYEVRWYDDVAPCAPAGRSVSR
ncbi:hypothetical protein M768_17755 [Cellulosimicrobium cellulans F16]|uniref:Uncharacterized protein n=1 Tax=Cellulosimicrobium cellulans F16 TaxID=1350482 RepID=A0A0M0F343_CELCE|nr:hypothetical protein [Cellulosimicrobium cellulans]KON71827.1 hypothetical protein M768_17755 [Cellulosimicrobium cellulans F16]